jgi:hypothetical protein
VIFTRENLSFPKGALTLSQNTDFNHQVLYKHPGLAIAKIVGGRQTTKNNAVDVLLM